MTLTEDKTMSEITQSQLSELTGLSLAHISVLVKRGEIPQGRREGRQRVYPAALAEVLIGRGKRKKGKKPVIKLEDLF
jgi:phage terminase Nu1 subunit (DNA packaging protein)